MKIGAKNKLELLEEIVGKMIDLQVLRMTDDEIQEHHEWLEKMEQMFDYEDMHHFRKWFTMAVEREFTIRWSQK
jgi:hypothetical protein